MTIKEWSTAYPASQDADPITGVMPDLTDESAPGAGDGDETRSSQVESLRDKLQAVCKKVGDDSGLPVGSLKSLVNPLGDPTWNYLDLTKPTGAVNNYLAAYQFDGGVNQLQDISGHAAHDLVVAAGTLTKTQHYNALHGIAQIAFADIRTPGTTPTPLLQLTGELTIEMVLAITQYSAAQEILIQLAPVGGGPDTAPYNTLYQMTTEGGSTGRLEYFHESGAGVNQYILTDMVIPVGPVQHIALTRDGIGTGLKFYQQGELVHSGSVAAAPFDGSLCSLRIGYLLYGTLFSLRIVDEEYSAAQILESYKRVRGVL